jgi:hypothetical protein
MQATSAKKPPRLWTGQWLNIVCAPVLLAITWTAWTYLGRPFLATFWTAIAFPVIHQVFVWLAWRIELRYAAISEAIGFRMYIAIFFLLFGGRFIALTALAWMDRGSLGLQPLAQTIVTVLIAIPGFYTMYSVKRYFGMVRAAGADHFDPKFRKMPFVKEGIFRFTSNAMYLYGFLLFWAIATGFNSAAALIVAAFSHAYIWLHFYATEKPDIEFLYASS